MIENAPAMLNAPAIFEPISMIITATTGGSITNVNAKCLDGTPPFWLLKKAILIINPKTKATAIEINNESKVTVSLPVVFMAFRNESNIFIPPFFYLDKGSSFEVTIAPENLLQLFLLLCKPVK